MKNKMRKIVAGCLLGVMCLGSSFTTHASEKFTMPNGEIVEITQSEDVNLPVTRSLYESSSFALGSNQNYYSVEFNAKKPYNVDENEYLPLDSAYRFTLVVE